MGLKILHLSDLHLDIGQRNEERVGKIVMAETGAPDVILVTGDIFNSDSFKEHTYPELIEQGVDFFNLLLQHINEYYNSTLINENILFVPGNHELDRKYDPKSQTILHKYHQFLEKFYKNIPSQYSTKYYSFLKEFPQQKVIIIGYASPTYIEDAESDESDYGEISWQQILDMTQKIKKIENLDDYNVIVALHHHFYMVEEKYKEYVDKSGLRNSESFFTELSKLNVCAILHGHKHETLNRRVNINLHLDKPDQIVSVLGCGSTLKNDTSYNSLNYIEVFPLGLSYQIKYEKYTCERSGYKKDHSYELPILSPRKNIIKIMEEIKRDPDLEIHYKALKQYDSITKDELFSMLDSVVCNFQAVSKTISEDSNVLYYLIAAIHYRSNWRNKQKGEVNFLDRITTFLNYSAETIFSEKIGLLYKLLDTDSIYTLAFEFDKLKNTFSNLQQKKCIIYLTLGILLTEYYFIIKYEAENFYKTNIDRKSSFKFVDDEIHNGIMGNSIEFKSDEDRRSLSILVKCSTAVAHKATSLVIKELELNFLNFEQEFSDYELKIYYIYPELLRQRESSVENIESHSFSAYIPTLIPLLAGRSIYNQPETFARELIQNSLDAINTRREKDKDFEPLIQIYLGEENGSQYFKIVDNGSGMDKYILERYLTTAGRSFYKSPDYAYNYKPISQFGIGFLSCFMLGKRITVETFHVDKKRPYMLDIPNFDGCFFIEDGQKKEPGTEITIYENPDLSKDNLKFDPNEIIKYIKDNILNIACPINLNGTNLSAYNLSSSNLEREIKEKTKEKGLFFSIQLEMKDNILTVADDNSSSPFKLLLYKYDNSIFGKRKITVLNCGIKIKQLPEETEKDIFSKVNSIFDCCLDFPAEILKLSVSRDELINILKVDWDVISEKQNKMLQEHIQYKKDNLLKTPYLICHRLDKSEYSYDNISLQYDTNTAKFKMETTREAIENIIEASIEILKLFIDEQEIDFLHEPKTMLVIKYLANNMVMDVDMKLSMARARDDMNRDLDSDLGRAIARAMDKAMAVARDRARAMARVSDMDMAMDRAMAISKFRAMTRFRDIAMSMTMVKKTTATAKATDIARARDRIIDRATARDLVMTMTMARDRARVVVMAKSMARALDKEVGNRKEHKWINRRDNFATFFFIQRIVDSINNSNTNIFVCLMNLMVILSIFPLYMSSIYTLQEYEDGVEFDFLNKIKELLKHKV